MGRSDAPRKRLVASLASRHVETLRDKRRPPVCGGAAFGSGLAPMVAHKMITPVTFHNIPISENTGHAHGRDRRAVMYCASFEAFLVAGPGYIPGKGELTCAEFWRSC